MNWLLVRAIKLAVAEDGEWLVVLLFERQGS